MKTFRKGGIHPDPCKLTSDLPITTIPDPETLHIALSQSIGAPAKPVVKAGDHVEAGQLLAEAGGFVSADVHAPASGTVKKIENIRTPKGLWQEAIVLQLDNPEEHPSASLQDFPGYDVCRTPEEALSLEPGEITDIVAKAGIVGLGGATFPTRVKLTLPPGKHADTIVLNGAECEPYLTCDDRLMRQYAEGVTLGAALIRRAVGARRILIGIEDNKPQAITAMRRAATDYPEMEVIVLRARYPQGSEKQLIEALTGRRVPAGGLPVDAGCVVDNVATAFAIAMAATSGRPLTRRIVTVSGPDVANPGNYLVKIGTSIEHIIQAAGGLPENTGKVIAGGPMMGQAVSHLDAPSTKGLGGIVILPAAMSERRAAAPCVRCGRCVDACPMGLEPYLLQLLAGRLRYDDCRQHDVMNCIECGCCQYSCPSARPLLDFIRLSKIELRKLPKK